MVEPRSPLAGLSTRLALWRILAHLGVETSLPLLDEESGDSSAEWLFQKLRSHGFEARLVQVQLRDLARLRLPTLALADSDQWILLRERSSKGWRIEHAGGAGWVPKAVLADSFSGRALEIEAAFPNQGGLWLRLLKLLPRHRRFLLTSLGASALVQALTLVAPWLTSRLVDGALAQGAGNLLQILCVGMVLTALFKAWAGWLRDSTLGAFSMHLDVALEKGLFDHLLHLPFKYLQSKSMGELLQAFTGIKRARALVLNRGLAAVFDAGTALAFLVYMMMLMPAVAGVVLFGALLLSLATVVLGYVQARNTGLQIRARQKEQSALAELLKGVTTLKATGSQPWVLERWKNKLGSELSHGLRQERLGLWEDGIREGLTQGSSVCIIIWGGFKVLAGELSLGQLLAFSQLSGSFVGAVTSLGQTLLAMALAKPQMAEVREAFATPRQARVALGGPTALPGPVLAEDVWFRYEEKGAWILQGCNLRVQPGSLHHVQGASGSGKSTLLKLLAGLYPPDSGRISIGGMDAPGAANLMAFLPQFPQLASGSILENLRMFSGDRPISELLTVARETGLEEWVGALPMGYQTLVASGGANLSGGQRQLVAITAVLASGKHLLLLDEALSNLDWVSRQRILQSPRFQGRTIIYASHEEVLVHEPC